MLEIEKAEGLRQLALDVVPQVANVGLQAQGPEECREPHRGYLQYPKNVYSLRSRYPICGTMETSTGPSVPLHASP